MRVSRAFSSGFAGVVVKLLQLDLSEYSTTLLLIVDFYRYYLHYTLYLRPHHKTSVLLLYSPSIYTRTLHRYYTISKPFPT